MASGSDSEGSVQFVADDANGSVTAGESRTSGPSRPGNFCMERNGVPQPMPTSSRITRSSLSAAERHPHLSGSYCAKRTEKERDPRGPPQKRTRRSLSQTVDTNSDLDVVEVEKTIEAGPSSQGRIRTASNQHKPRRESLRLQRKRTTEKAKEMEFNMSQVRKDRMKRENKSEAHQSSREVSRNVRDGANFDSINLDDDEEKQQSLPSMFANDSIEQRENKSGAMAGRRKSLQASEIDDEVVPVEKEAEEQEEEDEEENLHGQSKDFGGMDAPYTGATHLIFEFPPGKRGKIRVTEEERGRLSQRKYLNDSLIDFYIKYHESDLERRAKDLRFSATFFSSFFFGRLRRVEPIDYDGVKGWTKKVDIFKTQFVFVPICDSYHWSLIIVANLHKVEPLVSGKEEFSQSSSEAPRIIYLDSLDPKRGTEFGETMRQYLVEEWLAKKLHMETSTAQRKATCNTFKKLIPILRPNVPIQTNEYDCGLYLLNSFEMFLYNTDGLRDKLLSGYRDVRDVYSHVEITMLRKSIINLMDILERQWIHEQSPPDGESSEHVADDAKASDIAERVVAGTGIFVSGSIDDRVEDAENREDSDGGKMTSLDQKAAEPEESPECVPQPVSTDMPEDVSLVASREIRNEQPEKTNNRDMKIGLEHVTDLDDLDKQSVKSELHRRLHSNVPSTVGQRSTVPTRRREAEHTLRHSTIQESRNRMHEERMTTYYPAGVEETSAGQYHEELDGELNDGLSDESEPVEVPIESSSAVNARRMQEAISGARFS